MDRVAGLTYVARTSKYASTEEKDSIKSVAVSVVAVRVAGVNPPVVTADVRVTNHVLPCSAVWNHVNHNHHVLTMFRVLNRHIVRVSTARSRVRRDIARKQMKTADAMGLLTWDVVVVNPHPNPAQATATAVELTVSPVIVFNQMLVVSAVVEVVLLVYNQPTH